MKTFSKTFAALDIGSNSFHMLIAKYDGTELEYLYREKKLMRFFGENSKENYVITEEKVDEAIEIINYFKPIAKKHKATISAVATSAMRDAANSKEVLEIIFNETDVAIEIITGEKEAELAVLSLQRSNNNLPDKYLLFDLGGGSTEFIFVDKGIIKKVFSLQIGAVRLTNMFSQDTDKYNSIKESVVKNLITVKKYISSFHAEKCFGMGGTVSSIALMIERNVHKKNKAFEKLNNFVFNKDEFVAIYNIIINSTKDELKKVAGLEKTRVDIIQTGMIAIKTIMNELKIEEIALSLTGLREGIIYSDFNKMLFTEGK